MIRGRRNPSRREALTALGVVSLGGVTGGGLTGVGLTGVGLIGPGRSSAADPAPIMKAIPAGGEAIPAIGMGSWITFNVGRDQALRDARVAVLQAFFDRGGAVIDSSPMYGSSEEVIGYCLGRIQNKDRLFAATKVWTWSQWLGVSQMETSEALWDAGPFDLLQIHNLLDWEAHLETLLAWKAAGRVRYIGITTSHGRRHDEFLKVMAEQPIDFVQFTYNILDRDAEARLLPLAAERELAVIVNRPFRRGALFDRVAGKPLPVWAAPFDCANWAQFFLKFVVSHPAVTCAIPATSRVDHMHENMGAATGRLPDPETRARMARLVESL